MTCSALGRDSVASNLHLDQDGLHSLYEGLETYGPIVELALSRETLLANTTKFDCLEPEADGLRKPETPWMVSIGRTREIVEIGDEGG